MLVLDAILTGAKGINLWSSFRTPPPQRSARLYRALVERRLASSIGAGLLPTEHPFLYLVSATAMEGVGLQDVESAATEALNEVVRTASPSANWPRRKTSCVRVSSSRTTA